MNVFAISGSASKRSSNYLLLKAIELLFEDQHVFTIYDALNEFPLFNPEVLEKDVPAKVKDFKQLIIAADAILISTPEYTHNIPAVLKNMIEWCTHSGEFTDKKVLPITFTPYEPRGEYAMQSLIFSLNALNASVITQLPFYKNDVAIEDESIALTSETKSILEAVFELF